MRIGLYVFRECGALRKTCNILSGICFASVLALVVVFSETIDQVLYTVLASEVHPLILFFALLGVVLQVANITLQKICADVSALLKEVEETAVPRGSTNG